MRRITNEKMRAKILNEETKTRGLRIRMSKKMNFSELIRTRKSARTDEIIWKTTF